MRGFFYFIGLIVACVLLAWFLMNFVLLSDKDRVDRLIERGRRAVESGSILTLSGVLAPEYLHAGGVDRRTVLGAMQDFFSRTTDRQVRLISSRVEIEGARARATIEFTAHAESNGAEVPLPGLRGNEDSIYVMSLELSKESSRWRITASRMGD
ncbi:MAG: hypothetical protein GC154_19900 [bacterium]|nr:hypothetical protein [bacterium]